ARHLDRRAFHRHDAVFLVLTRKLQQFGGEGFEAGIGVLPHLRKEPVDGVANLLLAGHGEDYRSLRACEPTSLRACKPTSFRRGVASMGSLKTREAGGASLSPLPPRRLVGSSASTSLPAILPS